MSVIKDWAGLASLAKKAVEAKVKAEKKKKIVVTGSTLKRFKGRRASKPKPSDFNDLKTAADRRAYNEALRKWYKKK